MNKYILLLFISIFLFANCSEDRPQMLIPLLEEEAYFGDPITFGIIGDYGYEGEEAYEVSQLVKSWDPDFIITLGDNNYPDGEFETLKENITQYYEDYIFNPDAPDTLICRGTADNLATNKFFPATGNHDYDNPLGLLPYKTFFTLPGNEEFYDFVKGPVHFFVLDTYAIEIGLTEGETQATWLKNAISNSTALFKVVYCHHSPYSSSQHGNKEYIQWPFEGWGIDLVIAAHNHVYEKITPHQTTNFHYLVNGVGGSPYLHSCNEFPLDSQFVATCLNQSHGALKATANGDRLIVEFISIEDPEVILDRTEILEK